MNLKVLLLVVKRKVNLRRRKNLRVRELEYLIDCLVVVPVKILKVKNKTKLFQKLNSEPKKVSNYTSS
jgi:hypothetical protein